MMNREYFDGLCWQFLQRQWATASGLLWIMNPVLSLLNRFVDDQARIFFAGKYLLTVVVTFSSQDILCSRVLVTTIEKFSLQNSLIPQSSKMQFFQMVSRGAPKTLNSLSI
jgi:hypothetical protein